MRFLVQRIALVVFRSVGYKPHARLLYAHRLRIRRTHQGKMTQIDGLAFRIRTSIDQKHFAALCRRKRRTDRGPRYAADPAHAQKRSRQHGARRSRRNKSLRLFVLFEHLQRHDQRRILLLTDRKRRRIVIGDHFRAMHDFQPRFVIRKPRKSLPDLFLVARQHNFQIFITSQRLDGALHDLRRGIVAPHRIHDYLYHKIFLRFVLYSIILFPPEPFSGFYTEKIFFTVRKNRFFARAPCLP